jgi:hypothetical protein
VERHVGGGPDGRNQQEAIGEISAPSPHRVRLYICRRAGNRSAPIAQRRRWKVPVAR